MTTVTQIPGIIVPANALRTRITVSSDTDIPVWLGLGPGLRQWYFNPNGGQQQDWADDSGIHAYGIHLAPWTGQWIDSTYRGDVWAVAAAYAGSYSVCVCEETT